MNRFCGSSMSAIHYAVGQIAIGAGVSLHRWRRSTIYARSQGGFNHLPTRASR